jgi:hypothetical protein
VDKKITLIHFSFTAKGSYEVNPRNLGMPIKNNPCIRGQKNNTYPNQKIPSALTAQKKISLFFYRQRQLRSKSKKFGNAHQK